ncbi:hypothetical protein FACS18949_17020 [Clostridia bacterium]|nr:hypothetical protein FACS18949_17020 [Clostridia bacterium]
MLTTNAISLAEANAFVEQHHRHHGATVGHKFSIGAFVEDKDSPLNLLGEHSKILVGVAIIGRPVARHQDDGATLEVNRLCTDGTRNACSILYAAAARKARKQGYKRIITYILDSEPGTSLKASGFQFSHKTRGTSWNQPNRPRTDKTLVQTQDKKYFVKFLGGNINDYP